MGLQAHRVPTVELRGETHQPHALTSKHHQVIEAGLCGGASSWGQRSRTCIRCLIKIDENT